MKYRKKPVEEIFEERLSDDASFAAGGSRAWAPSPEEVQEIELPKVLDLTVEDVQQDFREYCEVVEERIAEAYEKGYEDGRMDVTEFLG